MGCVTAMVNGQILKRMSYIKEHGKIVKEMVKVLKSKIILSIMVFGQII